MKTFLGRSVRELNAAHGLNFVPGALRAIAHEAAHATVALAYGGNVTSLDVWAERGGHAGECRWTRVPSVDKDVFVQAAGAASVAFLHESLQCADPWAHCGEDIRAIRSEFRSSITDEDLEDARRHAERILRANSGTFDRLCDALVRHAGHMTEEQIRAVATPGMLPDVGTDHRAWTRAQLRTLADELQKLQLKMKRGDPIPEAVREPLAELERLHNEKKAGRQGGHGSPAGLRHGEAIPLVTPRTSAGYEHRARIVGHQ